MRLRMLNDLKSPRSTAIANGNFGAGVPVASSVTTRENPWAFAAGNDRDNGFIQPAMFAVSSLPTRVTAAFSSQKSPSAAKRSVLEKMGLGGFL